MYDFYLGLIGKRVADFLANECPATLLLTVFTHRNFVADFLQVKCGFREKRPFCFFQPPLGDLGATYDDHLRLIGKRVERLHISIT